MFYFEICCSHSGVAAYSRHLQCYAVLLGEWLQAFRAVLVPPSSGPFSQGNSRSAIQYHIASSLMLCSLWGNAFVKQVSVVVQSAM